MAFERTCSKLDHTPPTGHCWDRIAIVCLHSHCTSVYAGREVFVKAGAAGGWAQLAVTHLRHLGEGRGGRDGCWRTLEVEGRGHV